MKSKSVKLLLCAAWFELRNYIESTLQYTTLLCKGESIGFQQCQQQGPILAITELSIGTADWLWVAIRKQISTEVVEFFQ